MSEEGKEVLMGIFIVIVGILLLVSTICVAVYKHREININNFEKTIADLSDEQKCMHICGFQFASYFDKYKFCLEKCDRISERLNEGCLSEG